MQTNPIEILESHRDELKEFGVKSIALFGSVARGEARPDSDIDVLVEFESPVDIFEFLQLRYHLESLFGRRVDLATPAALKPQFRDRILKEAIYAG